MDAINRINEIAAEAAEINSAFEAAAAESAKLSPLVARLRSQRQEIGARCQEILERYPLL